MTEHRRLWLEKWGLIVAIITVIISALIALGTLIQVGRWTGAQETRTQVVCDDVSSLKSNVSRFPEKYYSKEEAQSRWTQHLQKESEERAEIMESFKRISDKLDRLYEMELTNNKKR